MAHKQFTATVNATSNSTINTEDTWIELFPPANNQVALKRVRVSFPHTTVSDVPARIRVQRASAAGATGVALTPTERDPTGPSSLTTCNVKNGTSAFTVGTAVANSVAIDVAVNTRGVFEWVARDDPDMIQSDVNQRIAILLRVNLVSMVCSVECDWEE